MIPFVSYFLQTQVTGERVTKSFKFLQSPENWVIVLIVLGVILFAALVYRKETGTASARYRYFLAFLRILIILAILFIIFEPVISTELSEVRDSYAVVLIDDSLSMSFKDIYADPEELTKLSGATGIQEDKLEEVTRMELVKKLLSDKDAAFIERLLQKNSLKVYTFSSGLREFGEGTKGEEFHIIKAEKATPQAAVEADLFRELQAQGSETKLADCLSDALKQLKGQRIAGIIIISDGRNNRGTLKPESVAEAAGLKKIPVYTIGVGNPQEPRDIVLVSVDAREVVLVGDKVTFNFTIKSKGFENENAVVSLKFNDTVVATKQMALLGKEELQRESILHRPTEQGEYVVTLSIGEKPGEQFKENNAFTFSLRVVDEKIKVLYVEGEPRWEYRYLKNALVRDPTMRVQCILQSADEGFPQESSPGVPPLSEFPVTKKELFDNYHVIIIGDIDTAHSRHGLTREQMEWVNEFVLKMRGGILFIAGENFNPDSFRETPLAELLPIEGEHIRPGEVWRWSEPKTQRYYMRLTPDGKESPVMRLEPDIAQNIELWENNDRREDNSLAGLLWYYPAKRAKPNAVVLAVHPTDKNDQLEWRPIIAYAYCGLGISMFVGVDETWRWRAGVGDKYFYRFYGQSIRFLSTRIILGKTKRFSLATADGKTTYFLGEKVNLVANVLDRDYNPSIQPRQTLCIEEPGSNRRTLDVELNPKHQGEYLGSITPTKVGPHKVWIGAIPAPEAALAFITFTVEVPVLEKKDPRMNKELLQKMASLSGGKYYELYQMREVPDAVQSIQEIISTEVSEDPLWNKWQLLILFTALITVEWIGRKMRRLI